MVIMENVFNLSLSIKMYENFCDVEYLKSKKSYYSVNQYIRNLKVNIDYMIRKKFEAN